MMKNAINSPGRQSAIALLMLLAAANAHAYIGPGAGLTAIGSFVALVAACIVAVIGFIWYPLKRIMRKVRGQRTGAAQQDIA